MGSPDRISRNERGPKGRESKQFIELPGRSAVSSIVYTVEVEVVIRKDLTEYSTVWWCLWSNTGFYGRALGGRVDRFNVNRPRTTGSTYRVCRRATARVKEGKDAIRRGNAIAGRRDRDGRHAREAGHHPGRGYCCARF